MVRVLSREEFIGHFNQFIYPDVIDIKHCIWEAENNHSSKPLCQYFVNITPIEEDMKIYWDWVETNMRGKTTCYSSDGEYEEWWGFTDKYDIVLWSLRWA